MLVVDYGYFDNDFQIIQTFHLILNQLCYMNRPFKHKYNKNMVLFIYTLIIIFSHFFSSVLYFYK
jgi:hypothetical protein